MRVIDRIADFQARMTAWRRDLRGLRETAFEECRTTDIVRGCSRRSGPRWGAALPVVVFDLLD